MELVPIEQDGTVRLTGIEMPEICGGIVEATTALYRRIGFSEPWICYLAVEDQAVVGTCGFAATAAEGSAEIAYFTFPGGEGQGVATRMAAALIALSSRETASVGGRFIAHTLPAEGASTAILKKLGFEFEGPVQHPEDGEVWRWRRPALA
ncbi:GNAT family N-acetyltransferase [Caenimonas sedimenti]|nr:GNAT family protein [Caenimonas sedimenti]